MVWRAASRNVLLYRCGERARVALRPSGTEPKAKIYVEASSGPCKSGTSAELWQQTCREVDKRAEALAKDFEAQALALAGLTK